MSKLIFREMVKGSAEDRAQVVGYFGHHEAEWFDGSGYRHILGYVDGAAVVGVSCDRRYREVSVMLPSGGDAEHYKAALAELERLARGVGSASLKTSADDFTDNPDYVQACISEGFAGDADEMVKILDQEAYEAERAKVRMDLVNAELSAEASE